MMERDFLPPGRAKALWCWMAFQYLLLPQMVSFALGVFFSDALVNFVYHLLSFLGVVLILGKSLLSSLRRAAIRWKSCALTIAAALAAYYVCFIVVSALVSRFAPDFGNRNDEAMVRYFGESFPLTAAVTVFLAPVTEEILFRGLLFSGLRRKSRLGAYLVSCLSFAFIHVAGYLGTYSTAQLFLALAQYLPAGLILSRSEEKSGTIVVPIAIHMVINAVSLMTIL